MAEVELTPEEKACLIKAINKGKAPAADLLPKLFPGMAEKFDVKALDRAKIPTLEYAGKRSKAAILAEAHAGIGAAPLQTVCYLGETKNGEWKNLIVQGANPQNFVTTTGPEPGITQYPNLDELISHVAKQIDYLHNEDGYPLSEIAIIYTQKSPDHLPGIHFPDLTIKALEKQGLYCNWIAEDYRAKRSYDVTTQSVTISTIHSVKGFDYACVFVIGLDWLEGTRWTEEQIRNLTYVAITRARERLYIMQSSN